MIVMENCIHLIEEGVEDSGMEQTYFILFVLSLFLILPSLSPVFHSHIHTCELKMILYIAIII